jgi:hypothetical protein
MSGVPGTMSGVPGAMSSLPATMSSLPDTMSALPGVMSGVPGTMSSLPDVMSGLPGTMTALPGTMSSVPDVMSGTRGAMSRVRKSRITNQIAASERRNWRILRCEGRFRSTALCRRTERSDYCLLTAHCAPPTDHCRFRLIAVCCLLFAFQVSAKYAKTHPTTTETERVTVSPKPKK